MYINLDFLQTFMTSDRDCGWDRGTSPVATRFWPFLLTYITCACDMTIYQCWVSYVLKVTCYSYKLLHEKSNLLSYLLHFFKSNLLPGVQLLLHFKSNELLYKLLYRYFTAWFTSIKGVILTGQTRLRLSVYRLTSFDVPAVHSQNHCVCDSLCLEDGCLATISCCSSDNWRLQ